MDKNVFKALILSLCVVFIAQKLGFLGKTVYRPAPQGHPSQQQAFTSPDQAQQVKGSEGTQKTNNKPLKLATTVEPFEEQTYDLKTTDTNIQVSNKGGGIKNIHFNKYNVDTEFKGPWAAPLSIVRVGNIKNLDQHEFKISSRENGSNSLSIEKKLKDQLQIRNTLSVTPHEYLYELKVVVTNQGKEEQYFQDGIEVSLGSFEIQKNKTMPQLSFSYYTIEDKVERLKYSKVKHQKIIPEMHKWASIQNTTYCSIIKESQHLRQANWYRDMTPKSKIIAATVNTDDFHLQPGHEKVFVFQYYLGPKLFFHLKSLNLSFENVIDYGSVFVGITKPLVYILNYIYNMVKSYGLAIIIMTLLFKILTYPLTKKSTVSMKKMQELQPKVQNIQNRFKNDPQQMNQEIIKLYRAHNANPMSGCFPMIIQLPIFIAFYTAIASSVELQGESFLFIKDLAEPDRLINFGKISINVLPLLMGGIQLISQQQSMTDPKQRTTVYTITLVMTVIFYRFPSGLVLYWLVSTLIGIWQTAVIKKKHTPSKA